MQDLGKSSKSFTLGRLHDSTTMNYFGQFVGIEKKIKKSHYKSRVSLYEAPTKNRYSAVIKEWNAWLVIMFGTPDFSAHIS